MYFSELNLEHTYPKRVLIIDDDMVSTLPLTKLIEAKGIETQFAFDGLNAITALKKKNFDFIIIDWLMPYKNGHETLLAIDKILSNKRHFKKNRSIPFLIYSGLEASQINIPQTKNLTFVNHVSKIDSLSSITSSIDICLSVLKERKSNAA